MEIDKSREIDFNIDESKLRTREIDFKIDKSKFQTRKFHFKIVQSEFRTREFHFKIDGSEFQTREFHFKIDKSKFRRKFINLKIDRSKFELLGEEIRQMATTNSPKMKQRTFYNVFENGPRVAGANATAANFKSDGFPTSFEVCQPCGRRMLNRAKGKQLTRKRCRPTENLQIL